MRASLAALAAGASSLAAACGGGADTSTPVPDDGGAPFDGRTAAEFYATNCSSCHGVDRRGARGPALTPNSLTMDDAFYFETIARGRLGTAMPAWRRSGLTDAEISALIDFLRSPP